MNEVIITVIIAAGTGFFTWLYSKLKTKRERKQSDLELINSAIQPLLNSIKEVTDQNNELVKRYTAEQDKSLDLHAENKELREQRVELIETVRRLEKEVKALNTKINNLIKKTK